MKKINTSRTLLSVALLGALAVAPLLTPVAQADPPSHAPAYGRKDKGKKYKKDKKDKKYDRRDDDRYDRDDRDNYGRSATYTGVVTNVRNNGFDLRSNGRTYRVYTSSVPRDLSRGDEVRVYGRLSKDNDIRNASVRITRNRGGNGGGGNYGDRDYRTVTGVVTRVRNSREFDIRVGNTTYNVYATSSTRGLNQSDIVRVYGRRSGNDLRDASVRITDNRGGGYDDNRDDNYDGKYESFRGQVVKVRNSREFDIRSGLNVYNVYASSSTNGLSIGDEVRVYGSRSGSNDIRNANVSITRNR